MNKVLALQALYSFSDPDSDKVIVSMLSMACEM